MKLRINCPLFTSIYLIIKISQLLRIVKSLRIEITLKLIKKFRIKIKNLDKDIMSQIERIKEDYGAFSLSLVIKLLFFTIIDINQLIGRLNSYHESI